MGFNEWKIAGTSFSQVWSLWQSQGEDKDYYSGWRFHYSGPVPTQGIYGIQSSLFQGFLGQVGEKRICWQYGLIGIDMN